MVTSIADSFTSFSFGDSSQARPLDSGKPEFLVLLHGGGFRSEVRVTQPWDLVRGVGDDKEETDTADVALDLQAIQSNALEAIQDYRRYLRNAENAGLPEVAHFVRLLMEEDSARATHCQGLLRKLGSTGSGRPAP